MATPIKPNGNIEYLEGPWSNAACYGYMIDALQELGWSRNEIRKVICSLALSFDQVTVEEAKQIWYNF